MRRRLLAALLALGCCAAFAENAPPEGFARVKIGEAPARFVLWRPAPTGRTLLVLAEDEPATAVRSRADLLQIALGRKMSVIFLGPAENLASAPARENLRKILGSLKPAKIVGAGLGKGADLLRDLAFEAGPKIFDALLLADAGAAPPGVKGGPFVVELYGSDAYWRAAPLAPNMAPAPDRRRFFLAGATLARSGEANCAAPVNLRDIEPARRALLVALDDFLHGGPPPPASREAELAPAKSLVWPKIPGLPAPPAGGRMVPKIDVDGNETSGLRLPDQALPIASFTGWNAAKDKAPGACVAGAAIPFAPSRAAREASGDPRQSLLERYGARSYFVAALRSVADRLVKERLLLPQDADAYVAAGKLAPF